HRACSCSLEGIVATGIEDQDRDSSPAYLQPVDDPFHRERGVAYELLLSFRSRRHIGREKEILTVDLEAMASKEEERRVPKLDRSVECQQGFAHRAPRLVLTNQDLETQGLQGLGERTRIIDGRLKPRHILIAIVSHQQRDTLLGQ